MRRRARDGIMGIGTGRTKYDHIIQCGLVLYEQGYVHVADVGSVIHIIYI